MATKREAFAIDYKGRPYPDTVGISSLNNLNRFGSHNFGSFRAMTTLRDHQVLFHKVWKGFYLIGSDICTEGVGIIHLHPRQNYAFTVKNSSIKAQYQVKEKKPDIIACVKCGARPSPQVAMMAELKGARWDS